MGNHLDRIQASLDPHVAAAMRSVANRFQMLPNSLVEKLSKSTKHKLRSNEGSAIPTGKYNIRFCTYFIQRSIFPQTTTVKRATTVIQQKSFLNKHMNQVRYLHLQGYHGRY
jgi:hypothetical protein